MTHTWRGAQLVVSQLPRAVGATGEHPAVLQQEQGVFTPAGHLLRPLSTEGQAVPGLAHRALLLADAQLAAHCIAPAQHCGDSGGRGREGTPL